MAGFTYPQGRIPDSPWPAATRAASQIAAIRHHHALLRLARLRADHFHLSEDVEALDHLAEDDVLTVQPRRGVYGDEELRAVGVRSCTPGVGAE